MLMAQNLEENLQANRAKGFSAVPHYFSKGDYLTYF